MTQTRPEPDERLSPELVELAQACGVATEFWDWQGAHVSVPASTVRGVLKALDIDAETPEAARSALGALHDRAWLRVLPPVVVLRQGEEPTFFVHCDHGATVHVVVDTEDGDARLEVGQQERWVEPRAVEGRLVGEATFQVPPNLGLGWHTLRAWTVMSGEDVEVSCPLVVTPPTLQAPSASGSDPRQAWGYMTQLYSVRSRRSWGLGDLADLAELASWSARELGASFVLVNPLHAAEPIPPIEASPYLPTTRRFANPSYLRVEDIREVAYLPSTDRALVEWQAEAMQALNSEPGLLDREAVWAAKRSALEIVYAAPRSPARQAAFDEFVEREGDGLRLFATWCALAEHFGLPSRSWPDDVRDPASERVGELSVELAARVSFFCWLQWQLDEQLAQAQRLAREAGMAIGVIHDLAVGVHSGGADVWALGEALAAGIRVGAPPDAFNQQGQDWSQPPWRPDRLAELGYRPYRDMLRTVLRHAGGLRVDHVLGLFRLWWIPEGEHAARGTYVRYDHEALIGILALEATRADGGAGSVVIGEDLGTVEPWVRDYLRERGILGTSILWFEKDAEGRPLRPHSWRELCLATVTTHDLPPTAGYLAGEHIDLRERLGLLTRSADLERAIDAADRDAVLSMLRDLGLLGEEATERERVEALHRLLTWTPARLVGVSLADAVGDRRAMNQPGTDTQYPNWRLPLADPVGRPVLLEQLLTSVRAASLVRTLTSR